VPQCYVSRTFPVLSSNSEALLYRGQTALLF